MQHSALLGCVTESFVHLRLTLGQRCDTFLCSECLTPRKHCDHTAATSVSKSALLYLTYSVSSLIERLLLQVRASKLCSESVGTGFLFHLCLTA